MKKRLAFVLVLVCVLGLVGCNTALEETGYSLTDGLYVLENAIEQIPAPVPYLLVHDGRLEVVLEDAISYMPSGKIERNGNEVILATTYGGKELCWTFKLVADNTLQFCASKSKILGGDEWINGVKFVCQDEFSPE